jgi:asparagine N-glycosylation enzyme membrane subunit Stt3
MKMNNGYFFLIVCWIVTILVISQWLDFLWRETKDVVQTRRYVLLFLAILLLFQGIYIPLSSKLNVNLGSIFVVGIVFLYYLWRGQSEQRLQMISVIIFLGVFYAVAYEVFFLDPILMIIPPLYLLPSFFVLFLLLTTIDLRQQWIMLVGGFIVGECFHKWFLYKYVDQVYLGDAEFRDQFMMGFVLITVTTLSWNMIHKLSQQAIRILSTIRKQEGG